MGDADTERISLIQAIGTISYAMNVLTNSVENLLNVTTTLKQATDSLLSYQHDIHGGCVCIDFRPKVFTREIACGSVAKTKKKK